MKKSILNKIRFIYHKEYWWHILPTIRFRFTGNKDVNYCLVIDFTWINRTITISYYEGNDDKLPF